MNKLIIADDEGKTTVVPLVRDEITIGRKEGNTIRLTERNVSRRHARLMRSNGNFVLEDMESYNGVQLNGDPILEARPVQDGDKITIGDYQLSLRTDKPTGPKVGLAMDEEPPPYARLVMLGPPSPGQEFSLEEGELVIGRTDENAIVINHRSISRSHAKMVISETGCRLVDMDSANGVRVNGADYTDIELSPGDLVELGTVRLRFVGPGELYQFDADATVQMDAVPEDILADLEERRSMLPIIIAVAVVALIGIGAALVVFLDGDEVEPVVVDTPSGVTTEPTTPAPLLGPDPTKRKAKAREYFEQERYEACIGILDGLGDATDEEARALKTLAVNENNAQKAWHRACNQVDPSDLRTIHGTCKQIQADSRYAGRACCKTAGERFGNGQIVAARQHRRSREFDQSVALLQGVTEDSTIPQTVRDEAQELIERWERSGPGRDPIAKAHTPRTPRPGKVTVPVRPPREKVTKRPSSGNALALAREAAIRNDQAGCIRALRNGPRSSKAVRLLISCYNRSGNLRAACSLATRHQSMSHARQFAQARCR